ncbi:MAG TPA: glycosyltransferase family 2 protein [Candidatus Limnocylindrales bacterium]|nr:glycosyltransferase family 2 protein [Candidatus Limnocylindrales bacterium]
MASDIERPSVAIILPAYNEELTVAATIREFRAAIPEAAIVVVDNNSRDGTGQAARAVFGEIGGDTRLIREPRQGKGLAVRRAFSQVVADVYVLVDADQTYPADRVHDLIAPILADEADMVVGDRLAAGRYAAQSPRPFHDLGNRLVLGLVNRLFGATLHDVMSGYRAVSRAFVLGYPILVDGFEIEVDMTLHALDKQFRVVEIPVEYRERPSGSVSKLRTFSDGRRVLYTILRVTRHYRPLLFFGTLALLFGLAGLVAAIPVAQDWIAFQYIYHVPLAILATGLEVVAAILLALALVLDSVVHLGRMSYERDLLNATPSRSSSRRDDQST